MEYLHWAVYGDSETTRREKVCDREEFGSDNTLELEVCQAFGWVGALSQHPDVGITIKPWQVIQLEQAPEIRVRILVAEC